MDKFSSRYKKGLLFIFLAILFLPLLQNQFNLISIDPLDGATTYPENIEVTDSNWFSGNYQEGQEKYITAFFGLRNLCVRLNNQFNFSAFKKTNAKKIIIGRENFLYEKNYIETYVGKDFIGNDSIDHFIKRIKFVSDTLAKLNKQLIFIFAPGKAFYYPEYIPSNYLIGKSETNYEVWSQKIKNSGINYIDFNKFFREQKNRSKYPLYPQYGVHWSKYGAVLATDSLIKKIEYLRKIDMPDIIFDNVTLKQPEGTDYDIGAVLNLLVRLKSFKMAYPNVRTESDANKIKPSVLVIGDSFYWGIFDIINSYQKNEFWYYNHQVYPETYTEEKLVEGLDLGNEIAKKDVFVVIATDANLQNPGWGFFENLESFYKGTWQARNAIWKDPQRLQELKSRIKTDTIWMEQIKQKAEARRISIDSMMTIDALWFLKQQN